MSQKTNEILRPLLPVTSSLIITLIYILVFGWVHLDVIVSSIVLEVNRFRQFISHSTWKEILDKRDSSRPTVSNLHISGATSLEFILRSIRKYNETAYKDSVTNRRLIHRHIFCALIIMNLFPDILFPIGNLVCF